MTSLLLLSVAAAADAREQIRIVGSPLVLAYAEPVAKRFALNRGRPVPSMEMTVTGTGFGMSCAGVGFEHPYVQGASLRMAASEFSSCQRNGVSEIVELAVGMDAIVLASSKAEQAMDLSPKQIFAALARQVPGNGGLVDNPAKTWADVDPALPARPIKVMGPSVYAPTY